MSPCSREHTPGSRTVVLLQEHQRPTTPCTAAQACRPGATTARRFLRWFGLLGRTAMGKQGTLNVELILRSGISIKLVIAVMIEKLFAFRGTREVSARCWR